jgi:hypothetical protein
MCKLSGTARDGFKTISHTVDPPALALWGQTRFRDVVDAAIVRIVLADEDPRVAMIISHPLRVAPVVNPKEALLLPAAAFVDVGTCNPGLLDFSVIVVDEVTASERMTTHVPEVPGWTDEGLQFRDITVGPTPVVNARVVVALLVP